MAITRTGSILEYSVTDNSTAGTVATDIVVPADAELVIAAVSGWMGSGDTFFSMSFTKGGVDTVMTKATGGDAEGTWQCAVHTLALPDRTGDPGYTTSTLKWDWRAGAPYPPYFVFSVTFWKGVRTASPLRSSGGVQMIEADDGWPVMSTPLLDARPGYKIVAFCGFYSPAGDGTIDSWSNLTELAELTNNVTACGAWATGDPVADTQVGIASVTNVGEAALCAVVLRPPLAEGAVEIEIAGTAARGLVGRAVVPDEVAAPFGIRSGPFYHVTVQLGDADIATLDTIGALRRRTAAGA